MKDFNYLKPYIDDGLFDADKNIICNNDKPRYPDWEIQRRETTIEDILKLTGTILT